MLSDVTKNVRRASVLPSKGNKVLPRVTAVTMGQAPGAKGKIAIRTGNRMGYTVFDGGDREGQG
jgi:hypothetical protein